MRERDAGQLKLAEHVVVLGDRTFTFEDLDEDNSLIVGGGRQDLGLPGRHDSVVRDELGEDSTSGLDTEGGRQRSMRTTSPRSR